MKGNLLDVNKVYLRVGSILTTAVVNFAHYEQRQDYVKELCDL